jgi:hypothetical protein
VPQIVEPDAANASELDQAVEVAAEVARLDRSTGRGGEHEIREPRVTVRGRSDGRHAVSRERTARDGGQRNRPARPGGLRGPKDESRAGAESLQRLPDMHLPLRKVDVSPAQAEQFPSPKPDGVREQEQRMQAVLVLALAALGAMSASLRHSLLELGQGQPL